MWKIFDWNKGRTHCVTSFSSLFLQDIFLLVADHQFTFFIDIINEDG